MLALLAVLGGLVLATCANPVPAPGAGAPAAQPAAPSAPAASGPWSGPPRKFLFAGYAGTEPKAVSDLDYFLPVVKGWYRELGIEFEKLNMPTTPQFAALDARQVDGIQDVINVPATRRQGLDPIVVFNVNNTGNFHGVARPGLNIRDPNAWVGMRCRVAGLKDFTNIYLAKMIKTLGGDPLKVQYTAAAQGGGFKDTTNGLLAGTFDCNNMGMPELAYGLRHGLQDMGYVPDLMPVPSQGVTVSASRLAEDVEYRRLVKDFIRALLRAKEYYTNPANRTEIIALVMDWSDRPPELERADFEQALDERLRLMTRSGKINDPQSYRLLFTTGFETGILDPREFPIDYTQYDFREILNYTLIDQALADEGMSAR